MSRKRNKRGRAARTGMHGRVEMIRAVVVASSLVAGIAPLAAQDAYPNRPIKILVGFPAGGPSDVPARLIAEKLRVALGQPVVVENKTGAAGMLALNDMLA